MTFLSGCLGRTVQETQIEKQYPPQNLLRDCPKPDFTGRTWADLLEHTEELKTALDKCNEDKRSLREWADG